MSEFLKKLLGIATPVVQTVLSAELQLSLQKLSELAASVPDPVRRAAYVTAVETLRVALAEGLR